MQYDEPEDYPDYSDKNDGGNTPLLLATWMGRTEAVRMLLDHGASINVKNRAGNYPLAWCARPTEDQTQHAHNSSRCACTCIPRVHCSNECIHTCAKLAARMETRRMHGRIRANIHVDVRACIRTRVGAATHTRTVCARGHTRTHARTHARTRTHVQKHTQTHTHLGPRDTTIRVSWRCCWNVVPTSTAQTRRASRLCTLLPLRMR